jgi:hypothetical protein
MFKSVVTWLNDIMDAVEHQDQYSSNLPSSSSSLYRRSIVSALVSEKQHEVHE